MNPKPTRLLSIVGLVFVLCTISPLLGVWLNHLLKAGPNLISDYESPGMPYANWLRLFDGLGCLVLIGSLLWQRQRLARRWGHYILLPLLLLSLLMLVDPVLPTRCMVWQGLCQIRLTRLSLVHGVESVSLGGLIVALSIWLAWRRHYGRWFLPTQLLLAGLTIWAKHSNTNWLFTIHITYQLASAGWLYGLVFTKGLLKAAP